MNIYGKQEFAIVYYNPTEIIYLSDVPITSKYTFNIEDQIKLKNLDGDRVNLLKGYHHKFEISIHDTDGTLYTLFKDAQQYQVRFYPHQDVDNYYTCNCILVKPIYVKNNVNKDGLNLVFETDSYQDLLNAKTKRVIHEAWNLEDIGEVGLNGASYATTGVFSFPTGKIGNCIKFPAGNNYFKFENWAWAIGDKSFTLNFWTKFDATAGYGDLMGIGTANLAAQTVRLTKNPSNGNGTVNLSLTVQGLTRATDVVLDEDVWHLVTITVGGGVRYI